MLQECTKYFKSNSAYKRVFEEMRKQWKKYGRVGGFIKLEKISVDEKKALTNILGRTFESGNIKFRFEEFEKALAETRFKGVSILELLESYFQEDLQTNKTLKLHKIEEKNLFFDEIVSSLNKNMQKSSLVVEWLKAVKLNKAFGYNIIISEQDKSKGVAYRLVRNVCNAIIYLEELDGAKVRLAVLATHITSDPHYFDRSKVAGKLLLGALCYMHKIDNKMDAEQTLELYYRTGIVLDEISSYTTLFGIHLYTKGGIHSAYEEFISEKESYVVTLSNLNKIVGAKGKHKIIFMVENPTVFSYICEELKEYPISVICTSGQMKVASLIVIDLLCEAGCKIYYSGDIDPEGIGIADRIMLRHPKNIIPWRFTCKDYISSLSTVRLTENRLKKLDKISNLDLYEIVKVVRNKRYAGYQEALIEKLILDIKSLMG